MLRKLASGGMAEVFLAKQIGMDGFEKLVVLKRILPHLCDHPEYVRMFLDEARTAADLRHPNIVHTFEVGEDELGYFMVMEFLCGQDLRSLFRKSTTTEKTLPLAFAVGMIIDACAGLFYAHQKTNLKGEKLYIVHRDISPQNMIVTYEGETKVFDFGIAQAAHQSIETVSGVLKGKYSYMSPEQAMGLEVDCRTDVFALGIVLYEMTTFHRLFKKENEVQTLKAVADCKVPLPSTILPSYPPLLEEIVLKALAKNPEDRFSSCSKMRNELEEFMLKEQQVYSQSRLGKWIRETFKDEMEKEKNLSLAENIEKSTSGPKPSFGKIKTNDTVSTRIERRHLNQSNGMLQHWAWIFALPFLTFFQSIPVPIVTQKIQIPKEQPVFIPVDSPVAEIPAQKKIGRLKVVVKPWADVYLDGAYVGSTPLTPRTLPAGEYQIRLENPQLNKKVTKTIQVVSGQDTLVKQNW